MKKNDQMYLEHISEAINDVEQYVKGISEKDFSKNQMLRDAISYKIQIIGEAANHLSVPLKNKINIPWKEVINMRNIIVHNYADVDIDILWATVKMDLRVLKHEIKNYSKV